MQTDAGPHMAHLNETRLLAGSVMGTNGELHVFDIAWVGDILPNATIAIVHFDYYLNPLGYLPCLQVPQPRLLRILPHQHAG